MNSYYLPVVIIGLMLICIGAVFLIKRRKKKPSLEQVQPKKLTYPRRKNKSLVRYYSYDSNSNSFNSLLMKLKDVSLYEPHMRPTNEMDRWFKENTHSISHNGSCLSYLNKYRVLHMTFWKNVKELGLKPDKDEKFQRLLISVYPQSGGLYCENFRYLLFHYAKQYKLLPQVEEILKTDSRFKDPLVTYQFARKNAEINQQEALKKTKQ